MSSVDNALRLLLLVGERDRLRIADAAAELGVARSTAHRLLQMLRSHDFVSQDPDSKSYRLGPRLQALGLQAVREVDERGIARPLMEQLALESGETIQLVRFEPPREIVCIESVESTRALRVGSRVGMRLPAHASAGGRAILSTRSKAEIRVLYPSARLDKVTDETIKSRPELEKVLQVTREDGWTVQRGETESDIAAVAAPIAEPGGSAWLALTVALPRARLDESDIRPLAEMVGATARKIAAELPGRSRSSG